MVENLQQVRAVYDNATERWEIHLVCKDGIETPTAPGMRRQVSTSASVTSLPSLTAPRMPTCTPATG